MPFTDNSARDVFSTPDAGIRPQRQFPARHVGKIPCTNRGVGLLGSPCDLCKAEPVAQQICRTNAHLKLGELAAHGGHLGDAGDRVGERVHPDLVRGIRAAGFSVPRPLQAKPIPEALAGASWATAAFLGSFILVRQHGLARGFGTYDDTMGLQGSRRVYGIPERPASRVVDAALDWLEDAPDQFFLWVHFFDPHAPWEGPDSAAPRERYAAEVERTDTEVGRLVTAVRARWPDAGTLFVATSDHGESLEEHGEGTHSLGIYDATQRVPLILSGAGLPAGTVVAAGAAGLIKASLALRERFLPASINFDAPMM